MAFIADTKQRVWVVHSQKTPTPQWLSGKDFKDSVRRKGHRMHDELVRGPSSDWLVVGSYGDVLRISTSNHSGVYVLAVSL